MKSLTLLQKEVKGGGGRRKKKASYHLIRYMLLCCHEAGKRGERRLGYKYNYCLFINNKVHIVW
jgi:hypothetical protein